MPHQWLLMGVQACRLPALKLTPLLLGGPAYRSPGVTRFKPIRQPTGTEGHINGFLWASKPAVCQPLNASPGVTRLKPFKRLNIFLACFIPQPTGTPRPHQWLLMGVRACRLPALKLFARRYTPQTLQTLKHSLGMLHPATIRHPKATSMASYGRLSLPFASP